MFCGGKVCVLLLGNIIITVRNHLVVKKRVIIQMGLNYKTTLLRMLHYGLGIRAESSSWGFKVVLYKAASSYWL